MRECFVYVELKDEDGFNGALLQHVRYAHGHFHVPKDALNQA